QSETDRLIPVNLRRREEGRGGQEMGWRPYLRTHDDSGNQHFFGRAFTLNPPELERCLTARTKATVPVHLFGQPADMDPILQFARANELFVIEDVFFFKQKTAYDLGLGIPAEPLFRSSSVRLKPLNCSRLPCVYAQETLT